MKVKSILVSQPEPKAENSPYKSIVEDLGIKVDFRPFVYVDGLPAGEIRKKEKLDISKYTAIILNSKNAVNHFFRVAEEMRYKVPTTLKYFCTSEAIALYLQKYVVYRKRKIYFGDRKIEDLKSIFEKFPNEKILFPSSDKFKQEDSDILDGFGVDWKRATFYNTKTSDLSDLKNVYYDILVFYSPTGIDSLFKNFPDFKQNNTKIAAFGNKTLKAAEEAGLEVSIKAPTEKNPSMTMAIERYIDSED